MPYNDIGPLLLPQSSSADRTQQQTQTMHNPNSQLDSGAEEHTHESTLDSHPTHSQSGLGLNTSTLPPHSELLLNLARVSNPILQLQCIDFAALQIIPNLNCSCLLYKGATMNPLLGIEHAANAVLAFHEERLESMDGRDVVWESGYWRIGYHVFGLGGLAVRLGVLGGHVVAI